MTDQPGTARQLCGLYGRRMTIEQLFRDDKSRRNGWALRDTRIATPGRFDRLLLILATAYLPACGVGPIARAAVGPSEWRSTTGPDECSIYTIGMDMLDRVKASPQRAAAAATALSELVAPDWG